MPIKELKPDTELSVVNWIIHTLDRTRIDVRTSRAPSNAVKQSRTEGSNDVTSDVAFEGMRSMVAKKR